MARGLAARQRNRSDAIRIAETAAATANRAARECAPAIQSAAVTPPPASGLPERQLLLIGPPQAPHPRGLLSWGIGARHCLWVAPGNGHKVWIPLPAELPGAMLARFV